MKDVIEATVVELVGMALVNTHRAADMQMFTFRSAGGEFELHVQCPWRIEREAVVVGYRDMRDPPNGVPAVGFDPNEATLNHRDVLLGEFVTARQANPRLVVSVQLTNAGDARLEFDDGTVLSIFPDSVALDDEYWRLIRLPAGDHYVVGGDGFVHVPA
jgi:hypothetical protein